MMKNRYFTKKETNLIKGISVALLLIHHLFGGTLSEPINWFGEESITKIIATISKVCVTLFLILSGYGLTESYRKKEASTSDINFTKKHLINLMRQYWCIFILFVPLGFLLNRNPIEVYGIGIIGIRNFILDFLGLSAIIDSPSMNQSWWYIEALIVCYLLFPILRKLTKKVPVLTMFVCFVPVLVNKFMMNNIWYNCREIFWLMPFVLGIILSQKDILNKYIEKLNTYKIRYSIITVFGLIASIILRSKFGLIVDPLFSLFIIRFALLLFYKESIFKNVICVLGAHSGNIYMVHSFMYYYYSWASVLYLINNGVLRIFVLLIECLIISFIIETIKKLLSNCLIKIKNNNDNNKKGIRNKI